MRSIKSLTAAWFQRRGSSTRDLYALGVIAITERSPRALVVPGIIGVLLLASFQEGGWFRPRRAVGPRRRGPDTCASTERAC
jgi:hypothetical protein